MLVEQRLSYGNLFKMLDIVQSSCILYLERSFAGPNQVPFLACFSGKWSSSLEYLYHARVHNKYYNIEESVLLLLVSYTPVEGCQKDKMLWCRISQYALLGRSPLLYIIRSEFLLVLTL